MQKTGKQIYFISKQMSHQCLYKPPAETSKKGDYPKRMIAKSSTNISSSIAAQRDINVETILTKNFNKLIIKTWQMYVFKI